MVAAKHADEQLSANAPNLSSSDSNDTLIYGIKLIPKKGRFRGELYGYIAYLDVIQVFCVGLAKTKVLIFCFIFRIGWKL